MKKVNLICVGKIKEKFFLDGVAEYEKRLAKFCDFSIIQLADYADSTVAVARESENILQKLGQYNILFDIGGEQLSSIQISSLMDGVYLGGKSEICFIIGGSCGVSDEVKKRCDTRISFGRVTFPHQLMRLIATEQIYRAFTISEHLPYHK